MSVEIGYLGIMRSIKDNEYYKEPLTMRLYEHLLIDANFKDGFFKGQLIKRGQTVKTIENLSLETGLTIKQVRTALDKLIKGKYLFKKATNKYSLLTLIEYDTITFNPTYEGKPKASQRQTEGKQKATIEESNNYNKEKNKEIERVNKNLSPFDFLKLNFEKELLELVTKYKPKIFEWDFCIKKFNHCKKPLITIIVLEGWLMNWIINQSSNSTNINNGKPKAEPKPGYMLKPLS